MPVNNWGTPLRDVLTEADFRLEVGQMNPKLVAFLNSDGEEYQRPYQGIIARIGENISETRLETWKKLFQDLGLLWVDESVLHLTRFGRLVADALEDARQSVGHERMRVAAAAARVLGRQQLLNPTTLTRDYPADCDVLPYRVIWQAIHELGSLHWEELHRVLLRVMRQEQIVPAINRIRTARAAHDYNPQDATSAEQHLGSAVYGDENQVTRRMTPWFSAAGFGGLLIERDAIDGRRSFSPLGKTLILPELTANRAWQDFGNDQRAWFDYLDEALIGIAPAPADEPTDITASELGDADPVFLEVQKLLTVDGASGILFVGPPGTGKSWYAKQIALKLTGGHKARVREVQFHPSYQYEDFVEGYVPDAQQSFKLIDRHLLEMATLAKTTSGPVVLIIDEFSRADPARVMGEAMTYMESTLRGVPFYLPSGRQAVIPDNLVFLATMNPEDRSVDEIDAAVERRWSKIYLEPDEGKLRDFLKSNSAPGYVSGPVVGLFRRIQEYLNLGHAFFRTVRDRGSLQRLWDTQIRHLANKKFRYDADSKRQVEALWAECMEHVAEGEKAAQIGQQSAEVPMEEADKQPNQ